MEKELIIKAAQILSDSTNEAIFEKIRQRAKFDTELCHELADKLSEGALDSYFRSWNGMLMIYDGRRYVPLSDLQFEDIVSRALSFQGLPYRYSVGAVDALSKHLRRRIEECPFNPKRSIISLDNGVLDTDTMEFSDFDPKFETTIMVPVKYDQYAECKKFDLFLKEVLPMPETREVLQEFIGYVFIDRTKITMEKICYLVGGGSNGKSVFNNVISRTLGGSNISKYEIADLVSDRTCDYKVADMNGKLLNYCSDMSNKDISGGRYKQLVSGEPIQARFPSEKPFVATLIPPLIVNVNAMPLVSDQSYGHHRRTLIIPFNYTVPTNKQDPYLSDKLAKETSGIFNWILEGTRRIIRQEGKFSKSPEIVRAVEASRIESSTVLIFLDEQGYDKDGEPCPEKSAVADVYNRYKEYCGDNRYYSVGKKTFTQIIRNEGYEISRRSDGMYVQFKLKRVEDVNEDVENFKEMVQDMEELPF